MKEDVLSDNPVKLYRVSYQNQIAKANSRSNGSTLKPKSGSSWGSQIVKGFTTEKKSKLQSAFPSKKIPLACSDVSNQKNQCATYQSRVKRSLISDFPCSVNSAQVHPHSFECQRIQSPASHDLFLELDHLRSMLQESKERELALQAELQDYRNKSEVMDLKKELDLKKSEIEGLVCKVGSLDAEKKNLSEQLTLLCSLLDCQEEASEESENTYRSHVPQKIASQKNLEMEVLELRRLNKELQLQKRDLTYRLSSAESKLATVVKATDSEILEKIKAEASLLRHTNEDLCKQVEGLQVSRLSEVEELAYLRWINSCLRHELCNSDNHTRIRMPADSGEPLTSSCDVSSTDNECEIASHFLRKSSPSEFFAQNNGFSANNLKMYPEGDKDHQLDFQSFLYKELAESNERKSPCRRHSISGPEGYAEDLKVNIRRQSDAFIVHTENNEKPANGRYAFVKDRSQQMIAQKYELGTVQSPRFTEQKMDNSSQVTLLDVEKCALRVPNPPPRPSCPVPPVPKNEGTAPVPPPPPPPPKFLSRSAGGMQRAPQVVELYHSLMKRESRKDSGSGSVCELPNVANVRSSMIGEIENRSSHLLAIKADVETKSEFVKSLIKEVNGAVYHNIEDVIAFVKWLDDELSFLVDERAVLKHFDWPEKKADTLREAAFGYRDLRKLEAEVTHYVDDPRLPCDAALKKMVALSEKMERCVYSLHRTRDVLMRTCKLYNIPTDWMLDTGIISKIKYASVKLAKKYMKRVAIELHAMEASDKDPALEYMLLQGVRFAFRIHQFAGGFDSETMHAFEELRNLADVRHKT